MGLARKRVATEQDVPDPAAHPRSASAQATLLLTLKGVRSSVLRLPPTVHGEGDPGFIAALIGIARNQGVSGYISDGSNRWPAVHRLDAAQLFRLALEQAPAGSTLYGVTDEGVPVRALAEVIGRHLNLPVVSVSPNAAGGHFGWLARFLAADIPASSALTRTLLGWQPTCLGLIDDLERGPISKLLSHDSERNGSSGLGRRLAVKSCLHSGPGTPHTPRPAWLAWKSANSSRMKSRAG